jgi:hypothetical protein
MLANLLALLSVFLRSLGLVFRSRADLVLEHLTLRQQVPVRKKENPRPTLGWPDRLFWVGPRRLWGKWSQCLVIVKPETFIRWHREGFKGHWLGHGVTF